MAKETSPAPAKSGQAKTRGTTKAKATETAKPDEIVAGAAPTAAAPVDPAATVAGSTQIQDGAPAGSTSTENTLQDGTLPLPGAGDGAGAGGAGDAPDLDDAKPDDEESPLPALSARLFNHSNQTHRIVKARLTLLPGESSVVEFHDDKHREQCEKHVSQIRSLNRWGEGEGLHWGAADE